MDNKTKPQLLVEYIRDGLAEQSHYGFVVLADKNRAFDFTGEDKDYPFYLRSCAKPLQASLIIDYGLDKHFDMTSEEIAICSASHAGEEIHVNTAVNLLKKTGLDESYLKCGFHKPISKTEQEKLLLSGKKENVFQNNCVGKHIMMLAICKIKNWDLNTYYEAEHPLQKAIKEKIYDLCHINTHKLDCFGKSLAMTSYPITKDGCGVPIHSMPLKNMLHGYLNLFCNPKYDKITNAFRNNPYIIGGENRLDTNIMQNSHNLIAKVGAGGLCIVVNLQEEEAFIVKICDCDMKAREIVVVDTLKNLHWADINIDRNIKTLHGEVIGKIKTVL